MQFTQEQFNKLAAKDDLKNFATKDDMKNFATKDDMKKVDKKVDKLSINVFNNTEDIKEIKEKMATKEDMNKILTAVDGIAKKFDNHQIEHVSNQAAHDRFEERITRVENTLELKPATS